jgi:hypothetical protein
MNDAFGRSADPRRALLREALLDLAYDASSYLRQNAKRAVRVSAALLIAASLAACGPSAPNQLGTAVQPLAQEVRQGLPTQPGRYTIVPNTLGRDAQGVYHFAWQRPGNPAGGSTSASASLLRLAQGATTELEIPVQGDPILYLPPNASIPLVDSAAALAGGNAYSGGYYPIWHPFYGGYRGLGYYDPPARTVSTSGTVDGATVSTSPAPAAQRVVGLSRAVSGKAGGTGSGVAATNKSGASVSTIDHGGAAAAKASGFSAGAASSGGGSASS